MIDGIAACETAPESVAVDTWAVDYVLLGKNGERICPAVAYRDSRTETVPDELEKTVPFAWLYGRTGIQMQKFNTVYQLAAQKKEMPDVFEKAEKLLMIPDYLAYRLSGVAVNEYTNASTTADSVFISAGISRLKYGSSELPAVAAILSSASALMKCGNRVSDTKNEAEPAMRVEQ